MVKTRFAPSPTGIPHLGTVRTAFYNYLFARHHKGKFILRIEDTDQARIMPESEKAIYEILIWLGLLWDEKYTQSKRLAIYKQHIDLLYDISMRKEEHLIYEKGKAIYFKVPKEGVTQWTDAVGQRKIAFDNKFQEDFIIMKSDGFPTYNFANVIDDHLMEITHVIRGDEFISSTPKHILLYKAFGWKHPVFTHLPTIRGKDKKKLSKRHGAKSALDYRNEGYLPMALLNYVALLGWNNNDDKEIMQVEEMVRLFNLKDINTGNPMLDEVKLSWMNDMYKKSV